MNRFASVTTVDELIDQAMGAASMCWEHADRAGIFDSAEAIKVSDDVKARLAELEASAEGRIAAVRAYADLLVQTSGRRPEVIAVDAAYAIRQATEASA